MNPTIAASKRKSAAAAESDSELKLKPRWEMPEDLVRALAGELDGAALRPVDFVTVRIARLAQLFNRWAKDEMASRFDLSLAEWKCVASLGDVGPLTAAQLCRLTDADKGQMSIALRLLEEKGLTAPQGSFGKAVTLKLTKEGVKVFNRSVAFRRKEELKLLSKLSAAQRIALYEALSILAMSFQGHSPNLE
jgi:DNA-binding MarR family transcriptional regulator